MEKEAISYIPPEAAQPRLRVVQPGDNLPENTSPIRAGVENEEPIIHFPEISSELIQSLEVAERDDHVSRHEFAHAYVAQHFNFFVESLTIVPKQGVYEGLTKLRGPFDNIQHYQVVGAAGAAATDMEGAGSDFRMVQTLAKKGGISPDEAIAAARSILKNISDEEMGVISRLIVLKGGTIKGHELPALVGRARYEVGKGTTVKDVQFAEQTQELQKALEANPDAPELVIVTQIEEVDLGDGMIGKYTKVNGEVDENATVIKCAMCGGTKEHAIDCKNKESSFTKPIRKLSRSMTLFDTSRRDNFTEYRK